ncbi:site-2 protease family protein [Arcobacter roscoffensis]|uniref:PDZ domain-containing protein n=1 Tax=Arcobacter roscoffensis TaxID=2961520 RepID=A0ABY5E0M6_9BACT|nr:site-2 protease family protein [Arcobacter roscoffensis]UTJ05762.1 hypothetical protein NJU99_10920 [Arcobacter roscoffensis]
MNTNFNKLVKLLIPFIYISLFVYILMSVLGSFLPKSSVEYVKEPSSDIDYNKYDGFYNSTVSRPSIPKTQTKRENIKSLSSYNLKGIYSTSSNTGWAIIENKRDKKSYFVAQYEELDGYILTKLFKNHVIFEKQAKEYKLEISKAKENISYEISRKTNNINENVVVQNDSVTVKRDYLNSYVQNPDKVWQNIAIEELRNGSKIEGFKVGSVNQNSVFGKLGLKQGDIIKAINNKVLDSYADAFAVYNNISKTKYLNIEILRNNEIMELNYEID